ncbi:tail fiber domain-containing protein, partial [Patiriisocius hiemis]
NSAISFQGSSSSGNESFAAGSGSVAAGDNSHAFGNAVTAYSFGETVVGYESASYTPSSTTIAIGSDRLFVVANNTTNNALNILKDGKMGISRLPTTNILEIEGDASKTTAGDWLANSDARLKRNIETFSEEKALSQLLKMRGVTYQWNDTQTGTKRPKGKQYGFIAQELMGVFPENVKKDNLGFYQTPYGTYDALYVQSIKALHSKVENLERENAQLKKQIEAIYTMLSKDKNTEVSTGLD